MASVALEPGASVSLQASAGSGKTWQLVSRVLRLLLDGAEPGGIVALTFTRKAAVEMRLRLNERLRALAGGTDAQVDAALALVNLSPTPARRERARGLHAQLLFAAHPPRAMTLHAFCQEILQRFALEAGVPPGFGLAENEEDLAERTWRRLQARMTAEPGLPAARALARLVELGFNEWTLRELVALFLNRRGDWWAYTEGQDDPVAYATERLRGQLRGKLGSEPDLEACLREADNGAFVARLRLLHNYLEKTGGTRWLRPEALARATLARGLERFDAIEDALYTGTGTPYKIAESDAGLRKLSSGEREHFLRTHAEVVHDFEPMRRRLHAGESLARSAAAFTLGAAALDALAGELARDRCLGFTELEWHTCRLLKRGGAADWVRYRLDRRVDHLLIDEFQDTSPTQWRMLLPLLEEMAAGDSGRARSLFIVGDRKQSIYGFRRADPRLLGRATEWMKAALGAADEPLHDSRRSAQAIIDFVNALFDGEPGERIGFTTHGTHRKGDWGRVEVALPVTDDAGDEEDSAAGFRDPLAAARLAREDERAQGEARLVSARIRALVESRVVVAGPSGPRVIGWGDVMVLARARTHLHHLERQLTADDIPFVGAARGTLLETSLARDLKALLKLLDAPHRNLQLAQVLRSPLFSADDALLARLAADARAHKSGWHAALGRLAGTDPLLGRAHALVEAWRALASRLPAHDLIDRIARDSNMAARYEKALPHVTGARVRSNLGALLQLALEADSGRYPSLPRFLEWLEAQEAAAQEAPDEPPPAAVTDQVRIMTVHAAKGLEAPAVFIYNGGSGQNPKTPRLLIDWPQDEERPTHFMVSGPSARLDELGRSLAEGSKARESREELNVLYVAATRARQFLHVSGFVGQAKKNWHAQAIAAIERLAPAAPVTGTAPGTRSYALGEPATGPALPKPAAAPSPDPRLRAPLEIAVEHAVAPSERAEGDARETAAAAARGTAIHRLLQRLTEGVSSDEALWADACATLESEPPREDFARWLADARALLATPALAAFFDGAKLKKAWNEVPVVAGGANASIDRLVDDGETLWVIDYKTHARPKAEALRERYRAQLAAYADAVRAVWPGRPVKAGLILTATREWVAAD